MIVTFVHVWVKEGFVDEFTRASIENQMQSVKEPGNLRFDLLQDDSDPLKFVFYEAYESEEDVARHKETAYYLKWRDSVKEWMARPRQGIKHTIVYPLDKEQW